MIGAQTRFNLETQTFSVCYMQFPIFHPDIFPKGTTYCVAQSYDSPPEITSDSPNWSIPAEAQNRFLYLLWMPLLIHPSYSPSIVSSAVFPTYDSRLASKWPQINVNIWLSLGGNVTCVWDGSYPETASLKPSFWEKQMLWWSLQGIFITKGFRILIPSLFLLHL